MADAEEAYPWKCSYCSRLNKKTMNSCPVCKSHWSTGTKHDVRPRNSSQKRSNWDQWQQQSWQHQNWEGRAHSRNQHAKSPKRTPSPRARKGKGKGGKKQAAEEQYAVPKAMQPFGGKVAHQQASDTAESNAISAPSATVTSTESTNQMMNAQTHAKNQEFVAALRKAYPDADKVPAEVADLIERTEKDMKKSIASNIHSSTRALTKAQKALSEAMEAKRKHRAAWMEYLKEGLKAWEMSLDGYKKQQAAIRDNVQKAQQDIANARQMIELNAKAAVEPAALPAASGVVAKEEVEDANQDDPQDQDEERLRSSLQAVLRRCAGSLGMAVEDQPSEEEIMDSEEEERNLKRPRSKDPQSRSLES